VRLAAALIALLALTGAAIWLFDTPAPVPELIASVRADGVLSAPCPARTLAEEKARLKQGASPPGALGEKLRKLFPPGSDAGPLEARLKREGFELFMACPNDDEVVGARWLGQNWSQPDAFVYWRVDGAGKLTFVDGSVSVTR
jgi:hypothetical protein